METDFSKMQNLLFRSAEKVSHSYWSFPQYIRDYMDRFLEGADVLTKEEVLIQLRLCTQRPPCGFMHEFSILRNTAWKWAPPYDFSGFIHGPSTCPNRIWNCLCAHSNILGLVLRALILLNREDKAEKLLQPIFLMMVYDWHFATVVQMGEQPYLMDKNWLDNQVQVGAQIMQTVQTTIALLAA